MRASEKNQNYSIGLLLAIIGEKLLSGYCVIASPEGAWQSLGTKLVP